ncbi:MAG: pentapeptide repeat-containing protein [Candidatus Micrarchaeales archaeon]|jgi:Uncharacterized low-complexity proteins, COG1357|uniref:Pentapeptide repeat protein n=1 Tax=Candidatus Micrarchaeum acidiphilum ARMAN-2 TaxID=425595 RepID=C7DG55_MICA2|nr:MAG: pentapeptide repeat protein [Candidatus Micrarchaeum acidiphilum ARMAN-2]MCW6161585.1 pentapeptide repeat-containing protein [Candidatus Micrarchaeales archaeon]
MQAGFGKNSAKSAEARQEANLLNSFEGKVWLRNFYGSPIRKNLSDRKIDARSTTHLSQADVEEMFAAGKRDFRYFILRNIDFSGKDLTGANFDNCDLRGSSFVGSKLNSTSFNNANLKLANFKDSKIENSSMEMAKLDGSSFENVDLRRVKITILPMQNVNFKGANLSHQKLRDPLNCNFDGANLAGAKLFKGFGVAHKLEEADTAWLLMLGRKPEKEKPPRTHGARLSFKGADLTGAELSGFNFEETNFEDAIMNGTVFKSCTGFNGANVKGTKLEGSDLLSYDNSGFEYIV